MGNRHSLPTFAADESGTDFGDLENSAFHNATYTAENCEEENPAWPFRSSEPNFELAEKEYPHSPVERYVATAFGDEIPEMRDDLIERKHHGEGFFDRHLRAWARLRNWKVDTENDAKEAANPAHECRETSCEEEQD